MHFLLVMICLIVMLVIIPTSKRKYVPPEHPWWENQPEHIRKYWKIVDDINGRNKSTWTDAEWEAAIFVIDQSEDRDYARKGVQFLKEQRIKIVNRRNPWLRKKMLF